MSGGSALAEQLRERIRSFIAPDEDISDDSMLTLIERVVLTSGELRRATASEKRRMVTRLFHSIRGFDELQPLIDDPGITEIMVNRHDLIFIEREGRVELTDVALESEQKLLDVIHTIVGRVNRTVTEASPIVDARLPDGSRVHVVLPPVSLGGPSLTIRKFPERPMTMNDLLEREALSEEAAHFLQDAVRAKYNIFISGGTGSGKTTFLNVLAQFIPSEERVITIEDAAELQLGGLPNLVRLETRNANAEGRGSITIRDLIRASLRMRPNRIIVGEVRGAEALDMLQVMNTGHDGSLSTGHANSAGDMLGRLETMVLSGASLPVEVIRRQTASAIELIVHLSRLRDRSRRVVEIQELIAFQGEGAIGLNPLYQFCEEVEEPNGRIIGQLRPTGNRLIRRHKLAAAGMKEERW